MDKVKMAREQHVEKQKQVKKWVKSRDCVRIAEEGGKCVGMVEAEQVSWGYHEGPCLASKEYMRYLECDVKLQKILGPSSDRVSSFRWLCGGETREGVPRRWEVTRENTLRGEGI